MRGGHEHRDGGDDGEGGEGDEAEPVDDHGREFPIHDDLLLLVSHFQAVCDEFELFQYALQFTVGRSGAVVRMRRSGDAGRRRRIRRRRRRNWAVWLIGERVRLQRVPVDPDEPAADPAAHGRRGQAVAASSY